jgi:ABC-type transport system substrate-binding protein
MEEGTALMLVDPAKAAGFDLTLWDAVVEPGCPPLRGIAITVCSRRVGPDPTVTELLSCDEVPSEAHGYYGENNIEWCDPRATRLMEEADQELDPARRLALMEQVYQLEALDMIGLPLFAIPAIVAWRNDRVAGPIDAYLSSPYGPFFNIDQWSVAP